MSHELSNDDVLYNDANGSLYIYVAAPGITWEQAKTSSELLTFEGQQGYLATVTTLSERDFIDEVIFSEAKPDNIFIGGSDAHEEGVWRWVTGPEGQQDDGNVLIFFDGSNRSDIPSDDLWVQGTTGGVVNGDGADNDYLYMY